MLHDDEKLCTIEVVIPTINVDPLGHPPSNVSPFRERILIKIDRDACLADLIHFAYPLL